jgi:hypothetical protein
MVFLQIPPRALRALVGMTRRSRGSFTGLLGATDRASVVIPSEALRRGGA